VGDRANVYLRGAQYQGQRDPGVFIYSHGSGYLMPENLAEALNSGPARNRMGDTPYLGRIIFDFLLSGGHGGETGWGISGRGADNDGYPLLVVDAQNRKVFCVPFTGTGLQGRAVDAWIDENPEAGLNIEEYIAVATEGWEGVKAATINRTRNDEGF
jgi:hypothetical protein